MLLAEALIITVEFDAIQKYSFVMEYADSENIIHRDLYNRSIIVVLLWQISREYIKPYRKVSDDANLILSIFNCKREEIIDETPVTEVIFNFYIVYI
ncbi:kinase-like domain-containing protein [Rhizophagus irregularis DAOM 181602=DAOM 197198]|nr:kinase-like domain-containing protein [Rhizophagus irregularis DAOM 181602=DAOM 197198]